MKKSYCTESKRFYGREEVKIEKTKPITEIPLELKDKEIINTTQGGKKYGIQRLNEKRN